jgi:hypothetical protein
MERRRVRVLLIPAQKCDTALTGVLQIASPNRAILHWNKNKDLRMHINEMPNRAIVHRNKNTHENKLDRNGKGSWMSAMGWE